MMMMISMRAYELLKTHSTLTLRIIRVYNINAQVTIAHVNYFYLCDTMLSQERMCSLVNRTKVVVFMRGTERRPDLSCRDSLEVAEILNESRVLWDAVNIVKDTNAEMAIREYSGGDTR